MHPAQSLRSGFLPGCSSKGFFISTANRTPSEIKSLHGLRGRKHRPILTRIVADQTLCEVLDNIIADRVVDPAVMDESQPLGTLALST